MNTMRRFTSVAGFSDRRRIPLLGKIRLGIKAKNASGVEYPKEVDYFAVPEEVQKVYGEKPKKLDVMFPTTDRSMIFPCSMRRYGQTAGLKCIGDGEHAYDVAKKEDRNCPCQFYTGLDDAGQKCRIECNRVGFLFVILYKVNLGGVYQIRTSSQNSVTDILSGFDYIEGLLRRPFNMIPLVLERQQIETHHDQKKQTHYPMKLYPEFNIQQANLLIENTTKIFTRDFMLPEPKDETSAASGSEVIEEQGIKDEEKPALPPSTAPTASEEPTGRPEPPLKTLNELASADDDGVAHMHLGALSQKVHKLFIANYGENRQRETLWLKEVKKEAISYSSLDRDQLVKLYYMIKHKRTK